MTDAQFDTALRDVARELVRHYPDQAKRVERGLVLALNRAATYQTDHWEVRSATDPEVVYTIGPRGCDCPDQGKNPDAYCKHGFAVYLTHAAMQAELTQLEEESEDA